MRHNQEKTISSGTGYACFFSAVLLDSLGFISD